MFCLGILPQIVEYALYFYVSQEAINLSHIKRYTERRMKSEASGCTGELSFQVKNYNYIILTKPSEQEPSLKVTYSPQDSTSTTALVEVAVVICLHSPLSRSPKLLLKEIFHFHLSSTLRLLTFFRFFLVLFSYFNSLLSVIHVFPCRLRYRECTWDLSMMYCNCCSSLDSLMVSLQIHFFSIGGGRTVLQQWWCWIQ